MNEARINYAEDLSADQRAFLTEAWAGLSNPTIFFLRAPVGKAANLSPERTEAVVDELVAADVLGEKQVDGRVSLTTKGRALCLGLRALREARQLAAEEARERKRFWKRALITALLGLLCGYLVWRAGWVG